MTTTSHPALLHHKHKYSKSQKTRNKPAESQQTTSKFAAAQYVFAIPELLESIFIHMSSRRILGVQRVCRTWRDVIQESKELRACAFLSTAEKAIHFDKMIPSLSTHQRSGNSAQWRCYENVTAQDQTKDERRYEKPFALPLVYTAMDDAFLQDLFCHLRYDSNFSPWWNEEASWQEMLLAYPAVDYLIVHLDWKDTRPTQSFYLSNRTGVTVGNLINEMKGRGLFKTANGFEFLRWPNSPELVMLPYVHSANCLLTYTTHSQQPNVCAPAREMDPKHVDNAAAVNQASGAAAQKAFAISELLEAILVHNDLCGLFVCQRVCQTWRSCIQLSTVLQDRMFLRSGPLAVKPQDVQINHLFFRIASGLEAGDWRYCRAEASWRRMLPVRPALKDSYLNIKAIYSGGVRRLIDCVAGTGSWRSMTMEGVVKRISSLRSDEHLASRTSSFVDFEAYVKDGDGKAVIRLGRQLLPPHCELWWQAS